MQLAGSSSWRFVLDVDELIHLALFVRDAVHLPVAGATVPPPLLSSVPDRADATGGADLQRLGSQWHQWWQTIVATNGRWKLERPQGDVRDTRALQERARARARQLRSLADPPEFEELDPPLRSLVQALHREGMDQAHRAVADARQQRMDSKTVQKTTKQVAREQRVSLGTLHGCVFALAVTGRWWSVAAPGVVLASTSATCDPDSSNALIRAAYLSALEG